MTIVYVGIDLAKNVFALHGVNATGAVQRGLLSAFGIALPQKAEVVRRQAGVHLKDLPGYANLVIGDLLSEVHHLDQHRQ